MIKNSLYAVLLAGALASACAPALPEYTAPKQAKWLDQNWSANERFWFHHATQGTSTLPIPFAWFVALEQPHLQLFGDPPMLKHPEYLARFGFIRSPKSLDTDRAALGEYGYSQDAKAAYAGRSFTYDETKFAGNRGGLPVGFARQTNVKDPVTGAPLPDSIGFTCAACHTGQLEYKGTSLRIDGAPAVTDLGKFREALGVALIYTNYVPGRFGRFAKKVLEGKHTPEAERRLQQKLSQLLDMGKKRKKITDQVFKQDTEEGFGRLDALNRIGNTVFFEDLLIWDPQARDWREASPGVKGNVVAHTAPVNYPQIWDTPWFDWVQYDASIMQPMVRNAGEALGVKAKVNLTVPGPNLYRSTVEFREIFGLEQLLRGRNPFSRKLGFKGLWSPKWPEDLFEKIKSEKKDQGRKLYAENCQECHLPPVNDPDWRAKDPSRKSFWDPMFWTTPNQAGERFLKFTAYDKRSKPEFANLVSTDYVGTDPAQASIIVKRQVRLPNYLGIEPGKLCDATRAGVVSETSFAAALASVVGKTADKWYDDNNVSGPERKRLNGNRPNCIQAKMAYKARPLNGIWATAPFLHNGSVANIYELLSPLEERAKAFCVGGREYDPVRVGYVLNEVKTGRACGKGLTRIDTSKKGNSNKGHEFKDGEPGNGVIGRLLKKDERKALIEYLKSL